MSFEWSQLLTWRMLANVLDIIVVWYFVYKLIMLIRGTKAVQLFKGIIVIALIKVISWYITNCFVHYGSIYQLDCDCVDRYFSTRN